MKSKTIVSVLAAALIIAGITGCNPSTSNPGTSEDGPTSIEEPTSNPDVTTDPSVPSVEDTTSVEETYTPKITTPVEINFWNVKGGAYQSAIEVAIETFKELEPNVTVNNVKQTASISTLPDVVTKGFTSGVYPDIVESYPDAVASYLDYEKVVDLEKYIDHKDYGWTAEEKADYIPAYLEEGRQYLVEGTYSLPFSKSTEVLIYNKTLLEGINLSSIDSTINNGRPINTRYLKSLTWDEFFNKLCPALLKYNEGLGDEDKILDTTQANWAVLGYDSDANFAITLTQQYGLPYTSLDRDNYKGSADFNVSSVADKFEWVKEMAEKHYIVTGEPVGGYTNGLYEKSAVLFTVSSTGGLKYTVDSTQGYELGVGYLPRPAEGEGTLKTISQGPSLCLLKHESDPNAELRELASWLFYKHLTNYENGLKWALEGGYSPIRFSVMNSEEYQTAVDPESAGAVDSLNYLMANVNKLVSEQEFQDSLYTTPAFKGSATARTALGGVMTKVVGGVIEGQAVTRDSINGWLNEAWNNTTLAIAG